MPELIVWEYLDEDTYRIKVPGGWLVRVLGHDEASICFYPDAEHLWLK